MRKKTQKELQKKHKKKLKRKAVVLRKKRRDEYEAHLKGRQFMRDLKEKINIKSPEKKKGFLSKIFKSDEKEKS